MQAIVFNGRDFAAKIEEDISLRVNELRKQGKYVKIVSFFLTSDPGSKLYTSLKQKKAASLGIDFVGVPVNPEDSFQSLISQINQVSSDPTVTGVMIQYPTGGTNFITANWNELVAAINPLKDVDGLRVDSMFVPATVKAIQRILEYAVFILNFPKDTYVTVVGSKGTVGQSLIKELPKDRYHIRGVDMGDDIAKAVNESEAIISVTGHPGLITADMVYQDSIVIDVGSPVGDVDFEAVKAKSSFITPVPGGVGPVTVACLIDNAVLAVQHALKN